MACASETSPVCLVHLVSLVHLVYPVRLVQLNKQDRPDRPNRPNESDKLANFFSKLLNRMSSNQVASRALIEEIWRYSLVEVAALMQQITVWLCR